MEEYRIEIKVKNNLIIKRIESIGYKTIGEFCRVNNLMSQVSCLGEIINMQSSPLRSDGSWKSIIIKISEILGCDPMDFFTDTQLNTILQTNRKYMEVKEAEMRFILESNENKHKLLDDIIVDNQKEKSIEESLKKLNKNQRKVIEMRMGLGNYSREYTFKEIGLEINLSVGRIRQIEAKALRILRNPRISDNLRDFIME